MEKSGNGPAHSGGTGLQSSQAKRPVFMVFFGPSTKPNLAHERAV